LLLYIATGETKDRCPSVLDKHIYSCFSSLKVKLAIRNAESRWKLLQEVHNPSTFDISPKSTAGGITVASSAHSLKVALVVPKCNLRLSNHCPPWNLGYIASYLRKTLPNVEIRVFDGLTGDDPERCVREFQPSVVGVTATTPQAPEAYRLGDAIRSDYPDILTVIGGIHATIMPKEALEHFDVVVVGEGEKTFSQIVQCFQNKQPQQGIIEGEPVEDLDDIPSPAFDLINVQHYLRQGITLPHLKPPTIGMITSRGCPYRCAFCYNCFRKTKVRFFSAKRVVEDILFMRKAFGINSIFFNDDEFLINNERIEELSALFKYHGIDKWLSWGCQVRATTVTVRLLRMIKNMGCVVLSVGLESGTERILRYLKSGSSTLIKNKEALDMAEEVGITMGGSFIFGTPTETLQEMRQTLNWALANPKLKFMGVCILAPYPGTKVWDLCKRNGLLPEKVEYEKLHRDENSPEQMYLVTTIPKKTFVRFIKDVNKTAWFISSIRPNHSIKKFVYMLGFPTVWRVFANHPMIALTEFLNIAKNSKTFDQNTE